MTHSLSYWVMDCIVDDFVDVPQLILDLNISHEELVTRLNSINLIQDHTLLLYLSEHYDINFNWFIKKQLQVDRSPKINFLLAKDHQYYYL